MEIYDGGDPPRGLWLISQELITNTIARLYTPINAYIQKGFVGSNVNKQTYFVTSSTSSCSCLSGKKIEVEAVGPSQTALATKSEPIRQGISPKFTTAR